MGLFDAQGISSTPQSQQTNLANNVSTTTGGISAFAQPYVNNLLTNAQGLTAIPTALQQQSYSNAANLGVAPQIGEATGMAGQAAQGAVGTAGTALGYGQTAAGYGQQATQAGQNYANMATNPSSIQAYMNPYIQQSLAPQLSLLNQQQALQGQQIQGQATSQGAFGGNRATLAQGLNAQNYDLARQQAIGQGYNTAFTNAQQAQQFGANLGLQGLQTGIQGQQAGLQGVTGAQNAYGLGLQGASTLGQLGQNQFNQQQSAAQLQNQLGTQQYLMPQQLLQTQQSMLQGLPVGSQTTTASQQGTQQGWQAAPNKASQIGGLGTAALAALKLANPGLFDSAGNLIKSAYDKFTSGSPTNNTSYGIDNNSPTAMPTDNTGTPGSTAVDSGGNSIGAYGDGGAYTPYAVNAKGGIIKSYAKGGLVKSGSDLADIRLYALLG